jgi:hypothetical protein
MDVMLANAVVKRLLACDYTAELLDLLILCTREPGCRYVVRKIEVMKQHWRIAHGWTAATSNACWHVTIRLNCWICSCADCLAIARGRPLLVAAVQPWAMRQCCFMTSILRTT